MNAYVASFGEVVIDATHYGNHFRYRKVKKLFLTIFILIILIFETNLYYSFRYINSDKINTNCEFRKIHVVEDTRLFVYALEALVADTILSIDYGY